MASTEELARRRERLSAHKRRLLEQRLRAATDGSSATGLPRQTDQHTCRATAAQRRFWFLAQLYPQSPAYNMHVALHLRGPLDPAALAGALASLAERHAVLRSRFEMRQGELWQEVLDEVILPLETLPALAANSDAEALEATLVARCRQPFDLASAPLARAYLLQADTDRHVLLLCLHHIICDERSLEILVDELGMLYDTHAAGAASPLIDPRNSYIDYAVWEEEQRKQRGESQLEFWRRSLRDCPDSAAPLPDQPRPPRPRFNGALVHRSLSPETSARLRELARREQTTLFAPVLAAFAALLQRYSGHEDLCIGTPVSLRSRPELESLVGLFLNTLAIRARISDQISFRELVRSLNQTCLDAYSNVEVPFEAVAQALAPDRDHYRNPLFDVMFVQLGGAAPLKGFGTLATEQRHLDCRICKVDLTLFFRDNSESVGLAVEYDTDLYESATVNALLEQLGRLLDRFVADPDRAVAAAELLEADEHAAVVALGRGPELPLSGCDSLLERIDNIARDRPDDPAVIDAAGAVSYGELRALSERWALRLAAMQPCPDCVALLLGRSHAAVAAMLGAWRAGACYVPLDPAYPDKRIEHMLKQLRDVAGREVLVVVEGDDAARIPAGFRTECWPPPSGDAAIQTAAHEPDPSSLAYVIFTSGSTGTPKAVGVSHHNLLASTLARFEVYPVRPARFLLTPSLSFDSSVAGLYWTLASGGTLIMASEDQARDGRELAGLIAACQVTHTLMLPSLYELVLRSAPPDGLSSLTTAIVAGEACSRDLVTRHKNALPAVPLYNEYGPTETTVWASCENLTTLGPGEPVGIGRPIPNVELMVLDEQLRRVPVGVPGELCIAGATVTPGYLGRGDESAGPLITALPGRPEVGRIYRSGDAVRWRNNGRLEFLGRRDEQIKLRGHRVEPAEITSLLAAHPAVREAATVAVAAAHRASASRLAAFVVAEDQELDAEVLTAYLSTRLPEYMIPTSISVVAALPKLPNGKLDTRAVRATLPAARGDDAEPEDDTYRQLKALWCKTLAIRDCRPDDDFFLLGGHSLLGVSLLIEIEQRLGVRLPLGVLYESRSLRRLSRRLAEAVMPDQVDCLVPAQPKGSRPPLFIAHATLDQLARALGEDQPLYGLHHGLNPPPADTETVTSMAGRYLAAVRSRAPTGPFYLSGFSFGAMLALEMARQLEDAGERLPLLVLVDPPPPTPEGDLGFRVGRVRRRIATAGNRLAQLRMAGRESLRIGARGVTRLGHRIALFRERLDGAGSGREARNYASVRWAQKAARSYQYPRYHGRVAMILPQRREASMAEQMKRWGDTFAGELQVISMADVPDHLSLMREPWVNELAQHLTTLMRSSGSQAAAATREQPSQLVRKRDSQA